MDETTTNASPGGGDQLVEDAPGGWWVKLGLASVAAVGAALVTGDRASADPQGSPCCSLARANECSYTGGNKSTWTCPGSYNKTAWTCYQGSRKVVCGECSAGSTCYSGPWICSIWYYGDTGTHA